MALAFTSLTWWLWNGKQKDPKIPSGPSLNSSLDSGVWELDTLKFPFGTRGNATSSSRRSKRKWHSREERKFDKEFDVVLVPSDGGCVSGSESDDSDWSIGWSEPHGAGFRSGDDPNDSFAVLVPCYGHGRGDLKDHAKDKFLGTIGKIQDIHAAEPVDYMQQWLASLQNI